MSNKFAGIETRRQKKAKNTSLETSAKASPIRIGTKSETNDSSFEKEEENIKQNKKVKTEYNSETKNALLPALKLSKKILIDCITLLHKCALNNDVW